MESEVQIPSGSKDTGIPQFCYCCFTKEGILHTYQIKTFALLNAFGLYKLSLCYICKQAARQADKFVEKVQFTQQLLHDNVGNIKTQPNYAPLKKLTSHIINGIDINAADPLNEQDLKKEMGSENSAVFQPTYAGIVTPGGSHIKVEIEVSPDNDCFDDEVKKESDIPESVYAGEINDGNQQKSTNNTAVACSSGLDEKVDADNDDDNKDDVDKYADDDDDDDSDYQPDVKETKVDEKDMAKKVIRTTISKKECLRERALKAKEPKFVEAVYKCEDCIKWFSMKSLLDEHMVCHTDEKGKHACPICKRRMPTKRDVDRHMLYHLVRYKCTECDYAAAQHNYARNHYLLQHSDYRPDFPCTVCGKSFPTLRGLKAHKSNMHKHEVRGIHKCQYCDIKPFATRAGYSYHLKHAHTEQVSAVIQRYACTQCDKSFKTPAQLKSHIARHTTTRDHYCVECDKGFKTKEALYTHYMTTTVHINNSVVKHACDQCDKRFGFKHLLIKHIQRDHEKIMNYRCERCAGVREFFSRGSYTRHIALVHEKDPLAKLNQPRLPCSICDKTFSSKKNLDIHQRVHTGERPFKCNQCSADFSQSGSLHNHVKLVHLGLTRDGTPKGQRSRNLLKVEPEYAEQGHTIP